MAQRKSSPPNKSAAKSTRPTVSTAKKPVAGSRPAAGRAPGARPPAKKPGKSIVNQKQTPWGLIGVTAAIVVFAVVIVVAVVVTRKDTTSKNEAGADVNHCTAMTGTSTSTYLNELDCAKAIKGVTFKPEANRNHVNGLVKYDSSPPVGGNHNGFWADCDGTVYPNAIANENAVHMLEHGAIWITYNKSTISASDLAKLKSIVSGQPRMALSPYPDLKAPISLQAWGYQLFVNHATDSRVQKFIDVLRYNPKTTPEYGAICSQPTFKLNPSTFGHPTS